MLAVQSQENGWKLWYIYSDGIQTTYKMNDIVIYYSMDGS